MQGDVNIESIQQSIDKVLKRGNQNVTGIIKGLSKTSDISGAGIAIAPLVITTLSPSVGIVGGALILLGQLGSLLKDKTKDENTIISLFKDLEKESKK